MTTETRSVIAIAVAELNEFGCPHCGYRSGSTLISAGGSALWECGDRECGKICSVLADGVTKSSLSLGDIYPELVAHPRRGIPSHGRPDKRPDGGGEFFRSRGIGLDNCACFVCGIHDRDGQEHIMLHNISAFVVCKDAGLRVVAMFPQGARLDYREYEPDRVQIKIGACDQHLVNLRKLYESTLDGIITLERISQAKA